MKVFFIAGFLIGFIFCLGFCLAYYDLLTMLFLESEEIKLLENKRITTISFDNETLEKLDNTADQISATRSELVNLCVEAFLNVIEGGVDNGAQLSTDQSKKPD